MSAPAIVGETRVVPVDDFVRELQEIVRTHPLDPELAQSIKYGKAKIENVRRWAKDYYHYIREDAQATAATLARCLDRKLFLYLSQDLSRKAGFYQIANPVELYFKFTDALEISRDELERHYPCAETLGALFTKRNFQLSSFLEGFSAFYLCSEGAMMDAMPDQTPFLAQKGFAEYARRHYNLAEGRPITGAHTKTSARSMVREPGTSSARSPSTSPRRRQPAEPSGIPSASINACAAHGARSRRGNTGSRSWSGRSSAFELLPSER
jgi:hypothetical protein